MYQVIEVSDQGCVEEISNAEFRESLTFEDYQERKEFPPPTYELNLKMGSEKNHSQLNDFLFFTGRGFVVSQKVKDILEDFNLPPHQFYRANVYKNKKHYHYYYFYYFSDAVSTLDFCQSSLYFINELNEKVDFKVNSLEEFYQFRKLNWEMRREAEQQLTDVYGLPKLGSIKEGLTLRRKIARQYGAHELIFGKEFDHSKDLFKLSLFSWMEYISQRLSEVLKQGKVTGIIISDIAQRQYVVERPNPVIKWMMNGYS